MNPAGKSSEFSDMFAFVGTMDYSPIYCVPAALRFIRDICGGEAALHKYMRDTVQKGADLIAKRFGTEVMDDGFRRDVTPDRLADHMDSADTVISGLRDCAIATVLLPITVIAASNQSGQDAKQLDRLSWAGSAVSIREQDVAQHMTWMRQTMMEEFKTSVAIREYKGRIWMRLSGQIYLGLCDFEWLGGILEDIFERMKRGESLSTIGA